MRSLIFTIADFADFTTGPPRGVITLAHSASQAQAKFDTWFKTLPIRVHESCGKLIDPPGPRDLADYDMRVERVYIRRSDDLTAKEGAE